MDLRCVTYVGCSAGVELRASSKNSPGKRRVVPYTSSAAVHWMSSLKVVRMPRRTSGSDSIQQSWWGYDLSEALSCRWNLSIKQLAMGW